jgi:hypothetical protein
MKFDDIVSAFEFVGSVAPSEHSALISKETGEIYYASELSEMDELPDDVEEEPDKYIGIPHKNDLNLGKALVLNFTAEHLPEKLGTVDRIFRSRGAYGRFKDLLEQTGQLEAWYRYEDTHTKAALREWCIEQGIELDG